MFHITSMHCFHPNGHFDLNEQHLEGLYSYKQPFPVRPTFHVILASVQFQLQPSEYALTGDNIIIFALCVLQATLWISSVSGMYHYHCYNLCTISSSPACFFVSPCSSFMTLYFPTSVVLFYLFLIYHVCLCLCQMIYLFLERKSTWTLKNEMVCLCNI